MRHASVDILRTTAIAVMVFVHFGENLAGVRVPVAGLGAPLFALLSGVSYGLWLRGQQKRGASDEQISKVSIRRGLFVFGMGFAFNILVWLPQDVFNWDVLTMIGAALIVMNAMRRLPAAVWLTVAGLIVFLSPFLGAMAEYDSYWVEGYYDGDMTLYDVLVGFLVTGYFPLFPWLAYSLVGYVVGARLYTREDAWRTTLRGGVVLLALAGALLLVRPVMPEVVARHAIGRWTMYPATIPYVASTLGMALVLLGLLNRFVDRNPGARRHERLLGGFTLMSRYAFTLYLLHHVVHIWPLWIHGLATSGDPLAHWRAAMAPAPALGLAVVFLVLCYLVLRRIPPGRRVGMEAWMRWLCDA